MEASIASATKKPSTAHAVLQPRRSLATTTSDKNVTAAKGKAHRHVFGDQPSLIIICWPYYSIGGTTKYQRYFGRVATRLTLFPRFWALSKLDSDNWAQCRIGLGYPYNFGLGTGLDIVCGSLYGSDFVDKRLNGLVPSQMLTARTF